VRRPALEIHHREDPDASRLDLVQEGVREAAEKATRNFPTESHSGLWMSLDGFEAPIHLLKERDAEPGIFVVVVLGRLVQFMFGESVKLGSVHSSQLGPSVPKHVGGWPAGTCCRVPGSIATVGFLCPEALILLL
jgi:hypothetical protein